jgi:Undecaprenyl-phosphate glucose phosphotransferase
MYFQAVPLQYYPRSDIKYLFVIFFATLLFWKFFLYYAFVFYRRRGYNLHNVIVLGYSPKARELERYFHINQWHGYKFLGFVDQVTVKKKNIIGDFTQLADIIKNNDVSEVYIAWDAIPKTMLHEVVDIISEFPLKVRIIPDLDIFAFKSVEIVDYGMLPVIQIHPGPLSKWYNRLIKRLFDVSVSLIIIIGFVSWFTVILYFISLFTKQRKIFFNQKRTCIDGKVFICHKYRSMYQNDDADKKQATKDDQRITAIGRFLRKWSLDEVPQFWNVLKGEMSIVGPRPHMLKHTEDYQKLVKRFMLRHTVKPGITGLAQVNGFRGEIKRLQDLKKRVQFDVNYIEEWTFNMDIKIMLLTVWVIIRGQEKAY